MSAASKTDLTKGPLIPHLLRMGLPMTWGIFAIISFQLVDIYYIGLLGTKELAAVSFTMPVSMIVFSLILGMAIGMSSVLSRLIGEGNQDTIVRVTTHGLTLALMVGGILSVCGLIFVEPIFRLLGANDEMMPIILDYMSIWFAGSVLIVCPIVGNAAIRATGDAMYPAIVMSFVSVINIALDPLLIFGLWGFPEMGVRGAAVATVLANGCAFFAMLYMLGIRKKLIRFFPFYFDKLGDSIKRLAFIAVPAGLTNCVQPLTNAFIISLLAGMSTEAVAAYGVVSRVEAFAFVLLMGLAGGMSPILGQNWGAKQFGRVLNTLRLAFRFCMAWSLVVSVVLFLLAEQVAALFTQDQSVVTVAAFYLMYVPISYIAGNLLSGWGSAYNAIGMPQWSVLIVFSKFVLIQIPLVAIGAHFYGYQGVFVAIAFTNIFVGVIVHALSWRYWSKRCDMK
jgi:putative MATE family efflux protein